MKKKRFENGVNIYNVWHVYMKCIQMKNKTPIIGVNTSHELEL